MTNDSLSQDVSNPIVRLDEEERRVEQQPQRRVDEFVEMEVEGLDEGRREERRGRENLV